MKCANARPSWLTAVVVALVAAGCSGWSDASPTAPAAVSESGLAESRSTAAPWSAPVNLGPIVNSAADDNSPAISRNGLSLYFHSLRPGGSGSADIWVAQRRNRHEPWGMPVNLGTTVNTTAFEGAPTFSRDGRRMYFISDRTGGLGAFDLWVSSRRNVRDDFGWQTPVHLGSAINSALNDAGPGSIVLFGDEFLFFNSVRAGGPGAADIFSSMRQDDGSFGAPVRVAELNSSGQDARPTIRHDGREVFFFSTRTGSSGLTDLWTSTRRSPRNLWSTPVSLGTVVNTTFADEQPALSRDARTLFFASNRPGGSGVFDLYMITRGHNDDDDDDDADDDDDDDD